MTKIIILLVVYVALILKNMCSDDSMWWVETPLDLLCAIGISAIKPTIICGLILYFF